MKFSGTLISVPRKKDAGSSYWYGKAVVGDQEEYTMYTKVSADAIGGFDANFAIHDPAKAQFGLLRLSTT